MAAQFDATQWQKPNEFIPERFDHSNPISLTPNGTKRSPQAFIPFSGGKRVCFGKTLAEATLKVVATYFTQNFDFKVVDKKFETELPVAHIGMSSRNKIEIVLSKAV